MVAVFAAGPRAAALARLAVGDGVVAVHDIVSSANWSLPATDNGDELDGELDKLLMNETTILILLEPPVPAGQRAQQHGSSDAWLDVHTQRIYTLALAIARASARAAPLHVVLVSSMAVFDSASDSMSIQPNWRRRPSTAMESLAPALAEFVLDEFSKWQPHDQPPRPGEVAAYGSIRLSVLRLGTLVAAPDDKEGARWWTPLDEAIAAITAQLQAAGPSAGAATEVTHAFHYSTGTYPLPPPPPPLGPPDDDRPPRRALLLGARGMMGPACATALSAAGLDRLIITDLSDEADSLLDEAQLDRKRGETVSHDTGGMKRSADPQLIKGQVEFRELDISDNVAVVSAMREADVCINCAVVRQRRVLAFNVNVAGTLFAIRAAVHAKHTRFINTGPSGTVVGPGYRKFSQVDESVPPWCGTQLYYMTKSLGHEITRIYSECFPIHVLTCLFGGVSTPPHPTPDRRGSGTGGWATTLRDCGQALRCATEVPLSVLASRHETFFISPPSPDGWLKLGKASKVLGWEPEDKLEGYFARL